MKKPIAAVLKPLGEDLKKKNNTNFKPIAAILKCCNSSTCGGSFLKHYNRVSIAAV